MYPLPLPRRSTPSRRLLLQCSPPLPICFRRCGQEHKRKQEQEAPPPTPLAHCHWRGALCFEAGCSVKWACVQAERQRQEQEAAERCVAPQSRRALP